MGYTANIEGFEGQNIEVNIGFWSGPKLLINGNPAQKGNKRGEMILQRNDGREVIAIWKPQFSGLDVPQLSVDGKIVILVEPLTWYQLVWGGWPVILLFIGGLLGAIAGVVGFSINAKVFRSGMNDIMKYVVSGIVSALAVGAYSIVVIILFS